MHHDGPPSDRVAPLVRVDASRDGKRAGALTMDNHSMGSRPGSGAEVGPAYLAREGLTEDEHVCLLKELGAAQEVLIEEMRRAVMPRLIHLLDLATSIDCAVSLARSGYVGTARGVFNMACLRFDRDSGASLP